ncbi:MAG: F0F1 ATP synthase subunit epsilon [Candidatus Lambdaproteobacteria bacterium]|nr:F0F1 ATP synthase subunit epsilon [Candidatus Lambdaproteobacteria bacterium]
MAEQLRLRVVTPRREMLSTTTAWVTLPGTMGELGILPQHVPLVTALDTGILAYEHEGGSERMAVHYGYAHVSGDTVTVLAEMAERAGEIDVFRARDAERRAREEISRMIAKQTEEEQRIRKYEAKLRRAMLRQSLGE